jgi:two-component system cell cycle sensor histidine kinase PleC
MDQEFRMRHIDGAGSGSAPGPRWCPDRTTSRICRHRVDVTSRRGWQKPSRTGDLRLRDCDRGDLEAFVLWDSANRLVLCNSKYQQL